MNITAVVILTLVFLLTSLLSYTTGYLDGKQKTRNIFYNIMNSIYDIYLTESKKDLKNGDHINAAYSEGIAKGSLLMLEIYYKYINKNRKEKDNGDNKQNSEIRAILSEMQVSENQ